MDNEFSCSPHVASSAKRLGAKAEKDRKSLFKDSVYCNHMEFVKPMQALEHLSHIRVNHFFYSLLF